VTVASDGESGGENPKRLKRVYASRADAKAAATAEARRIKRAAGKFSVQLTSGDQAVAPGQRVTASGFDSAIDGGGWLVEVTHMVGNSGYATDLMEAAGEGDSRGRALGPHLGGRKAQERGGGMGAGRDAAGWIEAGRGYGGGCGPFFVGGG
jgi:hypothetical protein